MVLWAALLLVGPAVLAACGPAAAPEATTLPEATVAAEVTEASEATVVTEATEAMTATHVVHWTYEGAEGPEYWATLSPDYAVCGSGTSQSPIDIADPAPEDLANITFNYQPSAINILNNGHTIQVTYDPGSFIELDGTRYDLDQFHFHAPAEHSVDSALAEAELHLVHKSADGELAVVGVLIEPGEENPAFQSVWANLPAEETAETTVEGEVNAADMLPAVQTTYRYSGSLTTPPCTEGVKWNVMTTPIEMSAAQLAAFTQIFEGNNRPVQALGERTLSEDTSP
jgi:carbonic anhydrase